MKWRTMETAPKNGTWVLLRGRNAVNQPMIPVVAAWCPPGAPGVGWFDSGSFKDMTAIAAGHGSDWMALPDA